MEEQTKLYKMLSFIVVSLTLLIFIPTVILYVFFSRIYLFLLRKDTD